jgi:undecaprenyl-diphosphatase
VHIGLAMIGLAILLFVADRIGRRSRPLNSIKARDWILIGLAQAVAAVVPGASRSGVTITAGLFCGLQREAAARFSFLLGAPIIFAAAAFELRKVPHLPHSAFAPMILGILASGITGYACIGFLMNYLRKRSTDLFVAYRLVFGIVVIAFWALGYLRK